MSQPLIAVLDYGIGNLRSAQKGLERAGADARLTADLAVIEAADAVVLPGVGAFGRCMDSLEATGLRSAALAAIDRGQSFLGICVGMQMLFDGSDEDPDAKGLGVIGGQVRLLPEGVKRPQMQWNRLVVRSDSDWLAASAGDWVYFVHSYAAEPVDDLAVTATCEYGGDIVAAVQHDNVRAVQFHPEKSGAAGLRMLTAFVDGLAA